MNKFFVEYIEKWNGAHFSDVWNERLLLEEIKKGEVEIIGIMPVFDDEN